MWKCSRSVTSSFTRSLLASFSCCVMWLTCLVSSLLWHELGWFAEDLSEGAAAWCSGELGWEWLVFDSLDLLLVNMLLCCQIRTRWSSLVRQTAAHSTGWTHELPRCAETESVHLCGCVVRFPIRLRGAEAQTWYFIPNDMLFVFFFFCSSMALLLPGNSHHPHFNGVWSVLIEMSSFQQYWLCLFVCARSCGEH